MMCNRMLIMYDGKILAADTPENLQRLVAGNSQIIVELAAPADALRECWSQVPEIEYFDVSASDGEYPALRADAAGRTGFAPGDFRAGAAKRLGVARIDAQPPFAGGYLRAGNAAGRRGRGRKLMRIFLTLTRRELAAFFVSFTGYVIIAAVTLLIGWSFVVLMTNLGSDPSPMPVTELFYRTYFFWLIVLLATPIITMRLFALEKFSGTFETLMTTPVGDLQVVAAKFTAAVIFYTIMWLPMLPCLFVVRHFTDQPGTLDPGTIGGMYLGVFLVGCLFLVAGLFRLGAQPEPDGGGHDQFRARRQPVFTRISGPGDHGGRAMEDTIALLFWIVRSNERFRARCGGHAHGDFLRQPHAVFSVFDPACGGKPALEIRWPPTPNPNPVSRPAAGGKSDSTWWCERRWCWPSWSWSIIWAAFSPNGFISVRRRASKFPRARWTCSGP